MLELFKIYFRLQHKNKTFASLEITYSLFLIVLVSILSYFATGNGYAFAITLSPLIATLVFIPFIKSTGEKYKKPELIDLSYYKYGFFAELAGVSNYLLYSIDIILIQKILNQPELVTYYKYISLIPFSFLFLPSMVIATDFVRLTENIQNKKITQNYINNYWKIFTVISGCVLILSFVFPDLLLSIFFKETGDHVQTFQILMIGVIGVLFWRGIYGNLLSSIGKMNINFIISTGGLALNFILNNFFIPKYGITGAAITTAIIMWLSGLLSFILFKKYQSKMLAK
jgi:O-antigen/teichoic acid export membrane protein